jgi:hypothetical protein
MLVASPPRGRAQEASPRPVTFADDVAPIVFDHCTSCHRPGEATPFSLMSDGDVRPRGRQIATIVRLRQMPPWKADRGDFPFTGDRSLSDADIAVIERWVEAGMPQGDPSHQPPVPSFADSWQLGKPDLIVRMPKAFPVPASGHDVYRNFVLPLNLDHDVWVRGVDFRPSARGVTHHSLFFLDATGTARGRDGRDGLPGYNGGMGGGFRLGGGSASGTTLGGWAPGAQPHLLPDGLAYFVPKGSDLILATHFHPSGTAAAEASTVGLYFAKQPPPKASVGTQLPPVFGLFAGIDIPAGDEHYAISDSFVIPVPVRAFGVSAHAHYLGKTMTMTATLPGGVKKTLIGIDDWDFNWQEQYQFAHDVDLPAGTRLDVTITYDNSAGNRRNPSSPPHDVRWGEQSTDEMGSMTLLVVADDESRLPELRQAINAHLRDEARSRPMLFRLLMRGAAVGR